MCGIAGIFAYHHAALPVNGDELARIRDYMTARGPDGKGEWFSPDRRIGLAHRRLSIIDLSERGAQPMLSADGRIAITFNGEIYNYRSLRNELETKGFRFFSNSDTEVLLHLYVDRGEAMLHDLRGMFAFALWDADKQSTLLARDAYGIKPLYYADDGWTLRFASQVKALLAGGKISRAEEPAGITGFYLFGSVPEPYTLYQEIRAVPAGSLVWVDASGASTPRQWFSQSAIWQAAESSESMSVTEIQLQVREALLDCVRHHMVSDVSVGAFLSAGIDSCALVGLMSECSDPETIMTQTLGFSEYKGLPEDEAPLAAIAARHFGVKHSVRIVDQSEFLKDLPAIFEAMDQPSIDGINSWFISKAAHEAGLKVAISGLGGDELFGGYPSFRDIPRWQRMLWLPSRIPGLGVIAEHCHSSFPGLFKSINPKAAGMLKYARSTEGSYLLRRGLFLPHEILRLLGPEMSRAGMERLSPLKHISDVLVDSQGRGPKNSYGKIALLEAGLYMRNQLLRDTDWASMAHSLEVRVPLVDSVLLAKLAGPLIAAKNMNRKAFLANAPLKGLPEAIAGRAKTGFTTPIVKWQQSMESGSKQRTADSEQQASHPWARHWVSRVLSR